MGDIADYYMPEMMLESMREEYERKKLDDYLNELERKYSLGALKWIKKDGEEILIQKMSQEHVMNTIEFLKKKKKTESRDKWIELLWYEFEKR